MLLDVTILLFLLIPCFGVDLTYTVSEETISGTYLGDIATDAFVMTSLPPKDDSLFKFIQLIPDFANSSRLFHVSKNTGKLYTSQEIDAETVCRFHLECYRVIDVALHRQMSFIKMLEVKIIIQDVNDNSPEFPISEVVIEFSERDMKGTQLLIPSAVDKDVSIKNSMISYELKKVKDDPFMLTVLERVNGKAKLSIRLEGGLDREVTDSYSVQVLARDMGSPRRECVLNVKINVGDENDNLPMFSQSVYNVSIGELHNISKPVIILTATDFDLGKNGKVMYRFSSDTSNGTRRHFELNKETGEIFLNRDLLPISNGQFKLFIEAEDTGNPPLSSIAMILIDVTSGDNHPPIIDVNVVSEDEHQGVGLSEDTDIGSFVAYLKVTDFDEGQDGEVVCYLHHNKFRLEQIAKKKYNIVLKNPLDREEDAVHDLIIVCKDQGIPSLRSEKRFPVQVLDVNDECPQFSAKTFEFSVAENEKSGFYVGFINVSDSDLGYGGQMSFSLLTSNEEFLPFKISQDGLITSKALLDREFQNVYKFQVFVKDHGIPSFSNMTDVIVEVKDRNDNAPYFTFPRVSPHIMNVTYHPVYSKNITRIKATDDDIQENALLRYRIMKGNVNELFAIGRYSGLLSFNRMVNKHDASFYELEIVVKDSGIPVLSAKTRLHLFLSVSNGFIETGSENKTDMMIHLNLAIVIVIVSVTLAISTVLIVTTCYIRCSDNKTPALKQLNVIASKKDYVTCADTVPTEIKSNNSEGFPTESLTADTQAR